MGCPCCAASGRRCDLKVRELRERPILFFAINNPTARFGAPLCARTVALSDRFLRPRILLRPRERRAFAIVDPTRRKRRHSSFTSRALSLAEILGYSNELVAYNVAEKLLQPVQVARGKTVG